MITSTEIVSEKSTSFVAARSFWILLICAVLYSGYFAQLGGVGFIGPDEPRYAWIARDMAQTGDWVTPRLYGRPWFEKPPLYYWSAALSFKLFGVSETAARLPSAISALLATLGLAWLGWRIYGAETARWLLLLLPTSLGMIGFSHAAATDMPFSATLTIAMVFAAKLIGLVPPKATLPSPSSISFTSSFSFTSILFGLFLGLAVLAKGPAAIILCGGTVFFWALFTRRWRDALRLLHPAGLAAFCVTALPWYILCARRNPDFIRIFIIEHNFKRYLTPEFQHIQPFWFYLPIVLAALLPWTGLLIPAVQNLKDSLRQSPPYRAITIFLLSWILFVCVFFSFSKSKLPGYILPAVPPLVLLCSVACTKILAARSRLSRVVLGGTCIVAVTVIVAALAYVLRLVRLSSLRDIAIYYPLALPVVGLVLLIVLAVPVLLLVRRPVVSVVCIVVVLVILLPLTPLNRLDSALSSRQACRGIVKARAPGEEVFLYGIPRSYSYGLNFYLERELADWNQRNLTKPALVVIGSPACWSDLAGATYHFLPESNAARWPVIELEPQSAAGPAAGRQSQ